MPRRTHRLRPRVAPLGALVLLAVIVCGWGNRGVVGGAATLPLAAHSERIAHVATDTVVAVAAPAVEAVAARGHDSTVRDRTRDALGLTTGVVALLLLAAHRRRLAFARTRAVRVAVVAHGGRAPPV